MQIERIIDSILSQSVEELNEIGTRRHDLKVDEKRFVSGTSLKDHFALIGCELLYDKILERISNLRLSPSTKIRTKELMMTLVDEEGLLLCGPKYAIAVLLILYEKGLTIVRD